MAIGTPVSIGTVQNKTVEGTTTLTTTAAVPAGALIVVHVAFDADGVLESVIDLTNGVGYANAIGVAGGTTAAFPEAQIYYFENSAALSSGTAISLSWPNSTPTAKAVSAFYVEGIATTGALDQTGTATGSSTTPSVTTAGATSQADEITIGLVASEGPSGDTFTQDASPAYGDIPVRVGTSGGSAVANITLAGGYFIETATGTKTYNPTLGTSRDYAAVIAPFKAAPSGTPVSRAVADVVEAGVGLAAARADALDVFGLIVAGTSKSLEAGAAIAASLARGAEALLGAAAGRQNLAEARAGPAMARGSAIMAAGSLSRAPAGAWESLAFLRAGRQPTTVGGSFGSDAFGGQAFGGASLTDTGTPGAFEAIISVASGRSVAGEAGAIFAATRTALFAAAGAISATRGAAWTARLGLYAMRGSAYAAGQGVRLSASEVFEALLSLAMARPGALYASGPIMAAAAAAWESRLMRVSAGQPPFEARTGLSASAQAAFAASGLIASGAGSALEALLSIAASRAVAATLLGGLLTGLADAAEALARISTGALSGVEATSLLGGTQRQALLEALAGLARSMTAALESGGDPVALAAYRQVALESVQGAGGALTASHEALVSLLMARGAAAAAAAGAQAQVLAALEATYRALAAAGVAAEVVGGATRTAAVAAEALAAKLSSAQAVADLLARIGAARPAQADGLSAVVRALLGEGEHLVGLWRPALVAAEGAVGVAQGASSSMAPTAVLSAAAAIWIESAGILGVAGSASAEGTQALIALSGETVEALAGARQAVGSAAEAMSRIAVQGALAVVIDGVLYRATVISESMPLGGGAVLVGDGAADVVFIRARLDGLSAVLIRPDGQS
jgi:hypothetical protein